MSLMALVVFYALLLLVPGGSALVALWAIGVALGGGGPSRPLTAKELKRAQEHHARRKAEWLARKAELEQRP